MPFGEFVHLHMQYYSFANTILKCAAFPFFTPAGKPTVNFYLDVFKKRNKKVDMHHISKYNKHKQIQHIKSYSIFYAIRQENPTKSNTCTGGLKKLYFYLSHKKNFYIQVVLCQMNSLIT